MDLGVVDGRGDVAVPGPTRGGLDQAGQVVGDAALVPAAVLGEGLQGLPVGGPVDGGDRLGDGVLLDVDRHGGDPLGEPAEARPGERPGERLEQRLPEGPDERSFRMGRLLLRGQWDVTNRQVPLGRRPAQGATGVQ